MKDPSEITKEMKVKVTSLGTTKGMCIHRKHLDIREIGKAGIVKVFVPGHGGDVWFVEQDNGVAAYNFTEFERLNKLSFLQNKWNHLMVFAIVAMLILLVAIAYVTDLMNVVYGYLAILLVAAGISKWLRKRWS